jgi:alkanesulfonate monooxygenase SsuD/methylene tetrahydromethanopterin reductase-like flavin-dependent oxidoreductase (luciferase family)
MRSIIAEHPDGALSVWPSPDERRAQFADRDARLKALGPEGLRLALAFLIGFHPRAFDAALDAVDPCAADGELALFR